MPAIKNTPNAKTCNRCACNHGGHCSQYLDEIEGRPAHVVEARRQCEGKDWTPRMNLANMNQGVMPPDTIETATATIHRDPWDKIAKTYE